MLLVAGELLKLKSKSVFLGLLLLMAGVVFLQYQSMRLSSDFEAGVRRLQGQLGQDNVPVETYGDQVREGLAEVEVAERVFTPGGGVLVSAGLMSSGLGAGLALLLGAWVVGREVSAGTIRPLLIRRPRRMHVLAAKLCVSLLVVIAVGGLLTLLLSAANGVFNRGGTSLDGNGALSSLLSFQSSWQAVAAPMVVCVFFVVLGAGLTVITRSFVGGVLVSVAILAGDILLSRASKALAPHSILYNVWSLGRGFRTEIERVATVYLWNRDFVLPERAFLLSATYLVALAAALAAVALWVFRRQEY